MFYSSCFACVGFLLMCQVGLSNSPEENNAEIAFTKVYETGAWGFHEGIGFSGSGSLVSNAAPYMQFLEGYIKANRIRSVVDVGCGDWTFSRYMNWEGIHYTGIDIVKSVIDKNQKQFSTSSITFMHGDAAFHDLPEGELLVCKDVLQHMSNARIQAFLAQITKYPYCLITNDVDPRTLSSDNPDIAEGDHRFLDLTQPPFNVKGVKIFLYPSGYVTKQVLLIENR